jgi:site-specific DNA-adenine methylase
MAPIIVKQLGTMFKQYFEPFCGSMAVLFAMTLRQPMPAETVNDLHGDLINLARVLQSPFAIELYDRTMRTLVCEDLLEEAERILSNTPFDPDGLYSMCSVERAYWYFVASWMGRNGVAGTAATDYKMLRQFEHARVVVSTYDCPRYRELYKEWTFIDCARMKNLHQQNGRGQRSKVAPEVLIVNGPEF